jgi:hypothetical protein
MSEAKKETVPTITIFAVWQSNSGGTAYIVSYHQTRKGAEVAAKTRVDAWVTSIGGASIHDSENNEWKWQSPSSSVCQPAVLFISEIPVQE